MSVTGTKNEEIEHKFFDLCIDVVKKEGLDLYDLEYLAPQSLLRLYIIDSKTDSAEIEQCIAVDRAMTPVIEEAEWMPEELVLEVSSPGVYRHLRTIEHFKKAIDGPVVVFLKKKLGEEVMQVPKKLRALKKFMGTLNKVERESIFLQVEEVELEIKIENIKKSNIEPLWEDLQAGVQG